MTPTPYPRANIGVQTSPAGSGRLQVFLTARDAACTRNNELVRVEVTGLTNATLQFADGSVVRTAPAIVSLQLGSSQLSFTLVRVKAGQASQATLLVTDGCGGWPTLVGGGPTAF
jgi:hypothetical protein